MVAAVNERFDKAEEEYSQIHTTLDKVAKDIKRQLNENRKVVE
jgi:hypothetical protein